MIDALILACAVNDAPPAVIREIITVESGDNPLAININSDTPITLNVATTRDEASDRADKYIGEGYTVDIGYMQVNSVHLPTYDLTAESLLDPCTNIAVGSEIFMKAYRPAVAFYGKGSTMALKNALSAYNTGTFHGGFDNGYVSRYTGQPVDIYETPDPPLPENEDPFRSDTKVNISFGK